MTSSYSLKERSLEEARELVLLRLSNQHSRTPLRFRPCIVVGPNEGYIVLELGYAQQEEFTIIR